MRILVLSLAHPSPPTGGHKMRNWAMLHALAACGHEIVLISFADHDVDDEPLRRFCRKVEIVQRAPKSLSAAADIPGRMRALWARLPYAALRFRSDLMQTRIRTALQQFPFDAVVAETVFALINVPASLEVPLVLDCHNLEHLLLHRYMALERNPLRRVFVQNECRLLRAWEMEGCSRADLVLACSEHDRLLLQELMPAIRCAIVPNAIDTDTYRAGGEEDVHTVLFTGGLDWYPNVDAVEFFARQILPEIRFRVPSVRFLIAGRGPAPRYRRRLARLSCEFTEAVQDIRPFLARASVCVVPLRIGSGTRLKILEAAAMRKPVVATRLGAEGLDFVDQEELALADRPQEFAGAVVDLLENASRRRAMGSAARRKVERLYSYAALRQAIGAALALLEPGTARQK
jgi:glycosyltransferase involved in cell wall biosynthesis